MFCESETLDRSNSLFDSSNDGWIDKVEERSNVPLFDIR